MSSIWRCQVAQHGQVLKLHGCRSDGKARWAYRYRVDGSLSKRPQVGGFATRDEAQRALRRELARLRPGREMTVAELVEEYLKIHQAAPSTIEKLRWLLSKATAVFGDQLIADLRSITGRSGVAAATFSPTTSVSPLRHRRGIRSRSCRRSRSRSASTACSGSAAQRAAARFELSCRRVSRAAASVRSWRRRSRRSRFGIVFRAGSWSS